MANAWVAAIGNTRYKEKHIIPDNKIHVLNFALASANEVKRECREPLVLNVQSSLLGRKSQFKQNLKKMNKNIPKV